MRLIIKRDELLKSLLVVGRAINTKSAALPVLSNILFELNDEGLLVTGSNFDLTIRTKIPYQRGEETLIRNSEQGSILINAKIITDAARKIDADEISLEVIDSAIAIISANNIEYKLSCVKIDEYPDIDLEPDGTPLTLTRIEFDSLVNQTAFAASVKEQRLILTAMHLEAADGTLTATTTDAARMAKKQIVISPDIHFEANVPAKVMVEVSHLLENSTSVNVSFSSKKALFAFENTLIATRLIVGDYPNTKNIVPRVTNYKLEVNAQDLLKAIDSVNILSIDRENVVDLHLDDDQVKISVKSAQAGSAQGKVENFKFEGEPLDISFNSEFVSSAIRALGSEDVTLCFVGRMKPFVIMNPNDKTIVQVVTPVNVY